MNPTLRFVLAVIGGIVAGGLFIAVIEAIGHFIYPPPDTLDLETVCDYVKSAPVMALVFPLLGWTVGAFAAGLIAKLIYRVNNKSAFVAGAILLLFILINFFVVECHPMWMEIIGVLIPVPAAMLGSRLIATR